MCDLLYDENGSTNIIDDIEKKTSAYLAVDSEGFLEICGSKMAVALASSCLDQMRSLIHNDSAVKKDVNENHVPKEDPSKRNKEANDQDTEVVWKRRETVKPKVVKPSKSSEPSKESTSACRSDELQDSKINDKSIDIKDKKEPCNMETMNKSIEQESGITSTEGELRSQDSITESQTRTDQHQLEPQTLIVGESLRDFARKLRYSESEVSSALSKLGPEADNNKLLMELVKAQNSAKQIEEGSSLERPLVSPPVVSTDPSTFRPIVIDGSNVAMR